MLRMTRRALVGTLAAAPLAAPRIVRAQASSEPVRIGLLSDVGGPYREVGGPGSKVAAELAVEDFGGSVLGRPLVVMQADDQNKADVAGALAREWIDDRGVNVLVDGAGSSAGLAIQQIAREKKRIFLMSTPTSTALIGKQCSPYGFQFACDTYALAKGVGAELSKAGGDTWFFITADYEFGYSLQSNTEQFVKEAGGKVMGSVRAPLGTADFSSYLVQAAASGAKVIGLANAGTDLQNCIKQAAEFGIVKNGQKLATLLMIVPDVLSIGQDVCQGLVLTNSFYWDQSPATRAWTERFAAKMGKPPTEYNAAAYAGVTHWLKAVKATNTLDADATAAKMHEVPINDFYNNDVRIMPNGCVPHTMYLWEVKPSSEAKHKWDVFKLISTVPTPNAYAPTGTFGCSLGAA
ncbi:MAG: branched-chain amino acid transport system substrate-binding protein [Acetobacteraceae bacterium]|nr:branched-chain amino acid transport system substrate-binding protein [Acetobacteraceae bacterium]